MSQQVKNEVSAQMGKMVALREMSQQVKNEVNAQMGEIVALRGENRRLRDEVSAQTDDIKKLDAAGTLGIVFTIIFGVSGVLDALGILKPIILKVTAFFSLS